MLTMKLDLNLLENVKERGARYHAACPACREGGTDTAGDNLVIFENGNFACAALQRDKEHAKRILQLAGAKTDWRPDTPPPRRTRSAPRPEDKAKADWWRENWPIINEWRGHLYSDRRMLAKFASELRLNPETLQDLTSPAFDALALVPAGFVPMNCKRPIMESRLGFVYRGALKIRDPWPGSKARFLMNGTPSRPWRSFWLGRPELTITAVHVVESESDAVALIEAGYERPFEAEGSVVIAVPGASAWRSEWAPMLAGREIHLWPDNDTAGTQFTDRIGGDCHKQSKSITVHNLS
jgi:hypothetical protein